jgi:hypothetical protein
VPLPHAGWFGYALPADPDSKVPNDPRWSPDLGLNVGALPGGAAGAAQFPLDPPWKGHDNLLTARLHNRDVAPATGISSSVLMSGGFTDWCNTPPVGTPLAVDMIDSMTDATVNAHWAPHNNPTAVVMNATASTDDGRFSNVQEGVAYQFHKRPGRAVRTTVMLGQSSACTEAKLMSLSPVFVPDGWSVAIKPEIALVQPGEAVKFTVKVKAPEGTAPGAGVTIPLQVMRRLDVDGEPTEGAAEGCAQPACVDGHEFPIGTLNVVARVLDPTPATVSLTAPAEGHDLSADVAVSVPGGNVLVEFKPPRGNATTVAAVFEPATGRWHATLPAVQNGTWRVIARWGGDASHAPVQSARVTSQIAA